VHRGGVGFQTAQRLVQMNEMFCGHELSPFDFPFSTYGVILGPLVVAA
jgi:hypothetical protein